MKMLSRLLLLVFFPSLTLAHDYFSWEKNDHATYISSNHQTTYESKVIRTSQAWRRVTNFAGLGEQWIYAGSTSGIYLYRDGRYTQLPDHTFSIGSTTTAYLGGCQDGVKITLFAKDQSLTTSGGQFDDVLELHVTGSDCRDAGITRIWLAKGVGVIAWESMTIAGPDMALLAEAKIGRVDYPMLEEVTLSANLPKPSMNFAPNLSLDASIQITNNTQETITYTFSSGQLFDIILTDMDSGKVVQRYSDGMAFTQAITTKALRPGQSLSFGGEMTLNDDVRAGNYTISVEITTMGYPTAVSAPLTLR
jgi:hypothetical protein